jgi:hypothetical protein
MKIEHIDNFTNGWLIGNFEPTLLKTENFELGIHKYKANVKSVPHFHKLSTEYNYIVSGKLIANNITLESGNVFIINPNEIAEVEFLEDTVLVIARNHSNPSDKYLKTFQ